jgi:hypothetical protein
LLRVQGVADVNTVGGYQKQYLVHPDADRLLAYGLTLADLVSALERNNANRGAAYIERNGQQVLLRGPGQLDGGVAALDELRGLVVRSVGGTTIRVDPADGVTPVDRVDPLVAATGAEIGFRSGALPGLQLYGALWGLELDSELLFVGDGGITEPSRGSRRYGVELGAFWTPLDWLIVDLDYAWSHARFQGYDPAGDRIPGAVEDVDVNALVADTLVLVTDGIHDAFVNAMTEKLKSLKVGDALEAFGSECIDPGVQVGQKER